MKKMMMMKIRRIIKKICMIQDSSNPKYPPPQFITITLITGLAVELATEMGSGSDFRVNQVWIRVLKLRFMGNLMNLLALALVLVVAKYLGVGVQGGRVVVVVVGRRERVGPWRRWWLRLRRWEMGL